MKFSLALAILLSATLPMLSLAAETTKAEPLPLETFYRGERIEQLSLSPNGKRLIALKNLKEFTAIQLIDLESGQTVYLAKTDNKKYRFAWVRWANNSHLLVSFRFGAVRSVGLGRAAKTHETRLFAMEAKAGAEFMPMVKPATADEYQSQFQDDVVKFRFPDDDHFLLGLDRQMAGHDSLYKINVKTGNASLVKKYRINVKSWVVDRQGEPRASVGYDDKSTETSIRVLPPGTESWQELARWPAFSDKAISILGFGKDPKDLYITAVHQGRDAVFKVDISKADFPRQLILSHPKYDIAGDLIYSSARQEPVGIYFNDESSDSLYWDQEFKNFQAGLDAVLPDTVNYITQLSADERSYLVYASNATTPGLYLLGNRDDKSLTLLSETYPGLNEDNLVPKQRISYKARDGLEIEGFLSTPKDTEGPSALIVLPHGGPFTQDSNSFDIFSAYLVNKGYRVFQPNFRGSTGYGHEFLSQAVGKYGMAMQDDITDGVQHLIQKGIADPKRICIMGASYGGYAALLGAARTPDLYQCSISFAGVTDLEEQRNSYRNFTSYNLAKKQMGEDEDQLEENSPVNMVDKIKIPVLLLHGTEDRSVPVRQARLMASELADQKKVFQYIEIEEGTHHLDYLPHRKQTFEAIDQFLNKYLPL
ncbi:S9 family peptidase [Rheinheimera sediminis]|uniref:alpha/beta hydrolase family protein n=1 Tax=Rheinheimera sp. YQF-1 TaxID=2499626 RepID=UPI000FD81255|nr:S9 family peptidase [Rheinheimera sp. YQF-1]RVT46452.1 S9 family peptidase [Rheinheimera sp. YQF-1]